MYKKFLLISILLLIMLGSVHAELTTDLNYYYKLDETSGTTVTDATGHTNLTSTNMTVNQTGIIEKSYLANAGGSKIDIRDYFIGRSEGTIQIWFKKSAHEAKELVNVHDTGILIYFDISTQADGTINIEQNWNANLDLDTSNTYSTSAWNHLVVDWNASGTRATLNGIVTTTTDYPDTIPTNADDGRIGSKSEDGATFGGYIDELGFWDRRLTTSEISILYNSGSGLAYPLIAEAVDANFDYTIDKTNSQIILEDTSSIVVGALEITDWNWTNNGTQISILQDYNFATTELTDLNICLFVDTNGTDVNDIKCTAFNTGDWTVPTTTFQSNQISGTTDQNITLTCTDNNSGCKAINYNVNNEGWNEITGGYVPVLQGTIFDSDVVSTLTWNYPTFGLMKGYDLTGDNNGIYQLNTTCRGALGDQPTYVYINATRYDDINTVSETKYVSGSTYSLIEFNELNDGNAYKRIEFWGSHESVNSPKDCKDFNVGFGELGTTFTSSFLYSGSGDHNIQYFSTDNADNNETTNTSYFTTYGSGRFTFYDENSSTLLNDVTYTISPSINGDSGATLTDTNILDLNFTNITDTTYTFTFTKTGYGTRYYIAELNELTEIDENFVMLPDELGRNIEFQVYKTDQTTLYTDTYIELLLNDQNYNLANRRKTDSTGKITFFLNPNDSAYTMRIYGSDGTVDYNSMTLTINHPKDESTATQIASGWNLDVTGLAWQTYTDLDGSQAIQIYANTVNDYGLTVDSNNATYYARKYYVSYLGGTTAATLQPYLVDINNAVSTTIYTLSAYTQEPVGSIVIKIYKTIPTDGRVLVEQVTTDAKGEALVSMIANEEYEFEIYNDGVLLGSQVYSVTSTSTTIYISLDDLGITTPQLESGLVDVVFSPQRGKLITTDTQLVQTIDIVNYYDTGSNADANITFISALIYITNTDVNGFSGNDVNVWIKTITIQTNTITLDTSAKTLDGNSYDTNGFLTIYVEVTTNKGVYYEKFVYKPTTGFDFYDAINNGMRTNFGCMDVSNQPLLIQILTPCSPLLFIAIFISLLASVAFVMETGFTGQETIAGIFLGIMGLFTYFGWVPAGIFSVLVVGVIVLMIAIAGRNRV